MKVGDYVVFDDYGERKVSKVSYITNSVVRVESGRWLHKASVKLLPEVPADWPVQPLKDGEEAKSRATCGTCGRSWDDGKVTSMTPAPSARCPFEYFHPEE